MALDGGGPAVDQCGEHVHRVEAHLAPRDVEPGEHLAGRRGQPGRVAEGHNGQFRRDGEALAPRGQGERDPVGVLLGEDDGHAGPAHAGQHIDDVPPGRGLMPAPPTAGLDRRGEAAHAVGVRLGPTALAEVGEAGVAQVGGPLHELPDRAGIVGPDVRDGAAGVVAPPHRDEREPVGDQPGQLARVERPS